MMPIALRARITSDRFGGGDGKERERVGGEYYCDIYIYIYICLEAGNYNSKK